MSVATSGFNIGFWVENRIGVIGKIGGDISGETRRIAGTRTMDFLKSTIWLLSDFGVRWYAYSEQSSNRELYASE